MSASAQLVGWCSWELFLETTNNLLLSSGLHSFPKLQHENQSSSS